MQPDSDCQTSRGGCECRQLLKLHQGDCMETHPLTYTLPAHHPSQHTGNALLLVWLRQHQCPSLAELRVQGGKCRAAFLPLTALPTSCFPMDSRGCRRQGWRLSALCCHAAASSPSGSDVSKSRGIGTSHTDFFQ